MFKINDYVMYGITGVCKILDIKEEKDRNSVIKKYYVLRPIYSKNTIIKTPVSNMKISMRKIHSLDEVNSLITAIPSEETLWIEDEKSRNEKFKSMLKSGDCEALIKLVKSIYENKKSNRELGKKAYKGDEEIMKTAERLLNEEFAIILNISPDEVNSYIAEKMSQ